MFDRKPRTVDAGGIKCPVDPDFRIMCDLACEESDKAEVMRRFYFVGLPEGVTAEAALEAATEFYRQGFAPGERKVQESEEGSEPPCFDFKEDEGYFYAAYLSAYGIDLNTAKLHWFDFCALFRGLPDDCKLKQIIGIRAARAADIPKYDRQRMNRLKRVYRLKKRGETRYSSAEERDRAMIEAQRKRFEEVRRKAEVKEDERRRGRIQDNG